MLRSWKLIGRPLWNCPIACRLHPPTSALVRPDPPLAQRRPWPNGTSQMPLRATRWGTSNSDSRFSYGIARIQPEHALGELRPGVGGQHRVSPGEPLLDFRLRRMIDAGAVVVEGAHVGELRVGTEQLRARDRRAVEAGAGYQVGERVGDELRQKVDRGLVALPAGRQVLIGDGIQFDLAGGAAASGRQVPSAAAGIADLEQPLAGQLALDVRSCSACSASC